MPHGPKLQTLRIMQISGAITDVLLVAIREHPGLKEVQFSLADDGFPCSSLFAPTFAGIEELF